MNISAGDFACVADTLLLTIRKFTVENNRTRDVSLETRNTDIRQSIFNRTSGSVIRNVTLPENIFINCNEGIGQEQGFIIIQPDLVQLVPVINDIRIKSSTFYFGNYVQGLIQANNINNLFLSGNYLATNSSRSLISICNSRNLIAYNNTIVNIQSKIDEYNTFDKTNSRQMNLSSLIDLPSLAFNYSFPHSVIITDLSHPNQKHVFISDNHKTNKILTNVSRNS
ncbi:unnamed protein product [Rotaria sp. Silwood2]|nr:unnamed protein product [Rotaria sp. Silwood2]CAF3212455.1 unnamed protein product [Rotaria sp. Silwood2]CAF3357552.1 unnamed protein product [Rotaria sp. Silwood2]CAF4337378.1 unnamed protein product [Rotaria sp. Silwood2]CAF4437335.1 unnamed protein product [Rotaria sp. Silwood2]